MHGMWNIANVVNISMMDEMIIKNFFRYINVNGKMSLVTC